MNNYLFTHNNSLYCKVLNVPDTDAGEDVAYDIAKERIGNCKVVAIEKSNIGNNSFSDFLTVEFRR